MSLLPMLITPIGCLSAMACSCSLCILLALMNSFSSHSHKKLLHSYRQPWHHVRWQRLLSMKDAERTVLTILQYQHLNGAGSRLDNPILCYPSTGIDIILSEPI